MLGVFAEFETNLRRERQLEGIAKAKAAGVYKGRPASIDAAQVRAMKAQGLGRLGNREGAQDRPGVGLSGIGSRLTTAPLDGSPASFLRAGQRVRSSKQVPPPLIMQVGGGFCPVAGSAKRLD
jgi:hypothetical protein